MILLDSKKIAELEKISSFIGIGDRRYEAAVLDLRDFQSKVKEHLGAYKTNTLGIRENGIYIYKNVEYPYNYILPKDKAQLNIIEKYRNDFFASDYCKSITFHKYFHHLNSSQAMCINFFYPLIKEELFKLILDIMGIDGDINYNSKDTCFEKESELEQTPKRKSNFDFYINLDPGTKVYFEIKYTENGFGKAKHDDEHIKKFHETYMPLLENNPVINDRFKEEDVFLNNYQIMRNLVHIKEDSYVIFLYPEGNKAIRDAVLYAREEIIENGWKKRFIPFTFEELIRQLSNKLNSKELKDYYNRDFSDKYLRY